MKKIITILLCSLLTFNLSAGNKKEKTEEVKQQERVTLALIGTVVVGIVVLLIPKISDK